MTASEGLLDRSVRPPSGRLRPFRLPPVASHRLQNGLVVRSLQRTGVPLVSIRLVLRAGETSSPGGSEGVAVLAGDALLGGTALRSATDLSEALEGLGSGLGVSTSWDATTVGFTCVAERVGEMLELLSEVVRQPTFPDTEVARLRGEQLASLRQRRMDPGRIADDALARRVFGGAHPFGRPLVGDESSVSTLDRDVVSVFAKRRHSPVGGGLVIVGDITGDDVFALAEKGFATWTGAETPSDLPPSELLPARTIVVVNRPGAVQSELRIGHLGPPRGAPEEIALRVGNVVLGGSFTSRLNLSLRERHGFTYGARSAFAFRRGGGLFSIGTAVQTEVTAAALGEAMDVLRRYASDGPRPEELERARDYLAGVFPLRMETTAQLASRMAELIVFGLEADYYHTYRDGVRTVDSDAVLAAVHAHIHPDRVAVVIAGDADAVSQEIEDLGIGGVEVVELV